MEIAAMGKPLLIALTLLCFTGCTTLQPLADLQPATIRQAVQPGDRVDIEKTDGTRLTLKVDEVGDDFLRGTDHAARRTIPFSEIRGVSTRVMTASDKVWTGVSVGAAVVVIGVLIAGAGDGGGGNEGGGPGY
jgi:hypothetical protein